MLLLPRDRLIYPAGYAPGILSTHPAALNCRFSGVGLSNGNIVSLLRGAKAGAADTGLPSPALTPIGPAPFFEGSTTGLSFSGNLAEALTTATFAAIFQLSAIGVVNPFCGTASTSNGAIFEILATNIPALFKGNVNHVAFPSLSLSAGVPYFLALSALSSTTYCCVLTNLLTGNIKSQSNTVSSISASMGNATYLVGRLSGSAVFHGNIAALSISATGLDLSQLLAWAADPWSFWYPDYSDDALQLYVGKASSIILGYASSMARGFAAVSAPKGVGTLAASSKGNASSASLLTGKAPGNASSAAIAAATLVGAGRGALTTQSTAVASGSLSAPVGFGALVASSIAVARTMALLAQRLFADPRFISLLPARTLASLMPKRQTASLLPSRKLASTMPPRKFASTMPRRKLASILGLAMPQGPDFSQMDVGETPTPALDFVNWLTPGATLASITSVVITNYSPTGGAAFVTASGSPQIGTAPAALGGSGTANTAVLQKLTGVNPGTARITITVVTSDGQTLIGWAHQPVGQPD
ncbi:MAG TPA: hypothetical protein VGU20_26045 [Stellaceae bacterium]|nr:hypothetical protein [Stellaceae bacterium]